MVTWCVGSRHGNTYGYGVYTPYMDSHRNPPESTTEREESTDTEAGDIRRKIVELLHTVARSLVLCHGRQSHFAGS